MSALVCSEPDPPLWFAAPSSRVPRLPDIFDEVEEDLRADRARRLLRRYGGLMVAAVLVVIVGVAASQAWRGWRARDAARVATDYIAAMTIADGAEAGRQGAAPGFAKVAGESSAGYATLARLRLAALKADSGDLPGALALWDQVARDDAADRMLRDLASLRWAMHQIDKGDPAAVAARLRPLLVPENPWHSLAQEGEALLALRQGDEAGARDFLKRLAADATAPDGVRGRANGLLSRLGG